MRSSRCERPINTAAATSQSLEPKPHSSRSTDRQRLSLQHPSHFHRLSRLHPHHRAAPPHSRRRRRPTCPVSFVFFSQYQKTPSTTSISAWDSHPHFRVISLDYCHHPVSFMESFTVISNVHAFALPVLFVSLFFLIFFRLVSFRLLRLVHEPFLSVCVSGIH